MDGKLMPSDLKHTGFADGIVSHRNLEVNCRSRGTKNK